MLCALLFFAFFSVNGYSQKGYVPGYIVSPTNDTIQTKINLNELDKNQCVYLDPLGKSCIGTPETVKAFAVSNGRIFRYANFKNAKDRVEAYFEVLVEGRINLSSFKSRFFVQKDNGEIHELLDTDEHGFNENGANYFRKKREYVGLLKYLLSDATTAIPNVVSIDLTRKNIIEIIRIYNEGATYIEELNRLKYKPSFKFGIEVLFASDSYIFRFPSESFADDYKGQFLLPGIGGAVKYLFSKHLLISSGIRLKYLDYSLYKSYGVESSKRYYTLKNNFITLSVPLIVDYKIDKLPFNPCAGLGILFEKSFLRHTTCLEESEKYSGTDFYSYEHQINLSNPINSYWAIELGGGSKIGKLSFSLKAQYLMDNTVLNSQEKNQFYHKSGLQLFFCVMF